MTARKPRPRKAAPRKRSKPTLEQRVADLEELCEAVISKRLDRQFWLQQRLQERIEALESGTAAFSDHLKAHDRHLAALDLRKQFRDASHDEPVSNAGEAVGQHFRILGDAPRAPWWRRFLDHMGAA